MNKIPAIISSLLIILAIFLCVYIFQTSNDVFPIKDKVFAYVGVITCLGALISAAFVVFSYIHTNGSFIESQRPHLLIFMQNSFSQAGASMSTLQYHNITTNRFKDLTIHLRVKASNREYSLSELFRSKMTMIGLDQRQRTFDPLLELNNLGLNVENTVQQGNEVTLSVAYS